MMNKVHRPILTLVALLGIQSFAMSPAFGQGVNPPALRSFDIADPVGEPGLYKVVPDSDPIQRSFVQQPPLIPHKVEGYEVSLNFNRCMDCHSWTRYRDMGATKVSLTHFKDRDDTELSNISPRRYFCLQCHVPQTDAPALVDNSFRPARGVR